MKKIIAILMMTFVINTVNGQKIDTLCSQPIKDSLIEKLVSVTVYHPTAGQCDKTPLITASGKKINPKNPHSHKWIAISWDLLKEFPFGTAVMIEGTVIYDGIYYVQDLMAKRWKSKIDILIGRKQTQISMKNIKLTKLIL